MALVLKDRVKETSTTVGTGTLTLAGAVPGFQSFSAIGTGNTTYYAIYDAGTGAWEVGVGTYTAAGTTLSRDTVLSSSNAGALVSFGPAQKDVFVTYPSSRSVYVDATNTYTVPQAFDTLTANTVTATTATLTNGTITTTPTDGIDLVNKTYVDTLAGTGLTYHAAINLESPNTAGNLTATYTNGGTTPTWTSITGGNTVNTGAAHGLAENDVIVFGTTTNGITAGTAYFVKSIPAATSITLSLARDGAQINTLTNGTGLTITSRANSGVGATLVNAGVQAALVIDGVATVVGNRVLIYSQTSAFQNGVYTVTSIGSVSTNWILTRATDADKYAPLSINTLGQNDAFYVLSGNTGKGETYVMSTPGTIVFGTTSLTFTQISSAQIYSAGTGLNLSSGTTFNISNTTVAAATYGSASAVPVFAVNAQGQLTSVTNTNIAISGSAVTGNIAGQAGSVANALTAGTYLTSGGTYDGSIARTFTVDATSANTASKVVARDISGNFSAGTITAALSGNATTATTATNIAGGLANQIPFQSAASTTTFAAAPSASNQLLSWNGSAFAWTLTPTVTSITLSGGTANGVTYLNASKVLTSGTALTFDGTNLGIGTTTPANKLNLSDANEGTHDLAFNRNTTYGASTGLGGISWYNQVGDTRLTRIDSQTDGAATNARIIFSTASSGTLAERMRLDSAGNLGIGTTGSTVDTRLVVSDSANNLQMRIGSLTAGIEPIIRIQGKNVANTTNRFADIKLDADIGVLTLMAPHTTAPFIDALNITSAGNVGIGTSAPSFPLDVQSTGVGSTIASRIYRSDGTVALLRIGNSSSGSASNAPAFGSDTTSAVFYTTNTEKMRLDSAGNLGLGVTPSAWGPAGTYIGLQIGPTGGAQVNLAGGDASLGSNFYISAIGVRNYQSTGVGSSRYQFYNGAHSWFTAPSGTAGAAITFTQAMTLTAAGDLGVGTTEPGSKLNVKGTLRLSGATSGYVGLAPAAAAGSTTYTLPAADGTAGQVLSTNGTATLSWATVAGGGSVTISNDTATSTDIYPLLASATTGTLTASKTSNAKLLYTPSTGEFKSEVVNALGGIFVNSATIDTNYTIAAGNNAGSFGPVTVNAGITVTVSSGSVWTVT